MMYSGPKKLVMRLLELACPQMTAEWSLVLINALVRAYNTLTNVGQSLLG
jgi:hypothetical protein